MQVRSVLLHAYPYYTVLRSIDAAQRFIFVYVTNLLNYETLIFYMECGSLKLTCHTLAFQDSLWAYTMFQL